MFATNVNIKYIAVVRVPEDFAQEAVLTCALTNETLSFEDPSCSALFDASILEVVSAADFRFKVQPHVLFKLMATVNALAFIMDDDRRVFAVITHHEYPESRAKALLDSVTTSFCEAFGEESLTVPANGLTNKASSLLKTCMESYEDPEDPNVGAIMKMVDSLKEQLGSNIDSIAVNVAEAETNAESASALRAKAKDFKKQATNLKKAERWKNIKCMAIMAFIVVAAIGGGVAAIFKSARDDDSDDDP